MDKLEKFITGNKDDFNFREPDPAVWNKIQKSIKQEKTKQVNWKTIIWRAAVVAIIFVSGYTVSKVWPGSNSGTISEKRQERKLDQIPQLQEVEAYYSSMINSKLNEVKQHFGQYPDLQEEIQKDFSELDSMYKDLEKDLFDNIATREVVEAMIQNYRLKLEILEDIVNELSEKDKAYENETKEKSI